MKTARRIRRDTWPMWRPKSVTDHIVLQSALETGLYYLCPGCGVFLPREYMRFCDCCGQCLRWDAVEEHSKTEIWEEE